MEGRRTFEDRSRIEELSCSKCDKCYKAECEPIDWMENGRSTCFHKYGPIWIRPTCLRYECLSCMGSSTGQIGVTSENGGGSCSDECSKTKKKHPIPQQILHSSSDHKTTDFEIPYSFETF